MSSDSHPGSPPGDVLTITPPRDFSFLRTAMSHGWCSLPPFSFSPEQCRLERVLQLEDGTVVVCRMTSAGGVIRVHCMGKGRLTVPQRNSIRKVLRSCLRLDETLGPFHREMRRFPSYRWISSSRAGRLLRAPTVFEDVVKMICTTNCTWALTTLMVRNLVHHLGAGSPNGTAAFPTPASIAETSERFLRNKIKAGYRAPYLLEFAQRVASGELDPESWRRSALPTEDLMTAVRTVKGIGPYAAENILRLLGRYEHLAFDSWVRRRYYTLFHKGRRVRDASIEARYAPFGRWKGLVFWLEMTRDWHEGKFPV